MNSRMYTTEDPIFIAFFLGVLAGLGVPEKDVVMGEKFLSLIVKISDDQHARFVELCQEHNIVLWYI